MSFYVFETLYRHARKCKACGKGMSEGYLDEHESQTYCSKECLYKTYKPDAVEAFLDEQLIFWTTWYDEVEVVE